MSNKIENMTFEQSLSELESLVRTLETGGQKLDESIANYTRGTQLRKHCQKKLQEATLKVEKIIAQEDGALKTEDFNPK